METHILACDDEESVRELLSVVLGVAGYQVETATDGAEALQRVREQIDRFQLVLTDHKMPRLDGLGLVRGLRASGFAGKIMVLSGSLDQADIAAYTEMAVDRIMIKPFDFIQFRKVVSELLSRQACTVI